jgi:PAT family beta-lactamase induction signal transducer AmpG
VHVFTYVGVTYVPAPMETPTAALIWAWVTSAQASSALPKPALGPYHKFVIVFGSEPVRLSGPSPRCLFRNSGAAVFSLPHGTLYALWLSTVWISRKATRTELHSREVMASTTTTTTATAATSKLVVKGKRDVLTSLRQPKVAVMLVLGFSSGLPFFLSGNTLGYWLRDEGTTLGAIGFLSWVGLAYSLKFLWAPFIDRLDAPLFGRFGRRRGWLIVSQLLVAVGLLGLSVIGLKRGLVTLGVFALIVAFASSTQDIVVDAWRIEAAGDSDELGLLTAAYQLGYRAALLISDALILIVASNFGWPVSYSVMAALMAIGLCASFVAAEPLRARQGLVAKQAAPLGSTRGIFDAVIGPFAEFFRVHGWLVLLMLAMISFYRLPEYVMGPMANPFYHDLGLSKDAVGAVRASIGLVASLLGIAAGGFCALRFGYLRTLIVGVMLQSLVIANFATLAYHGADLKLFGAVMFADNFGVAFAVVALVTYMSSLTSIGYTATQYALLSSAFAYIGKFAKGFSGVMVERLSAGRTLLEGYGLFFIGAGLLGVPALVLCITLARIAHVRLSETPAAAQTSTD